MSFLTFNEIGDTGKTKKYEVLGGDSRLAIISWYAPWRRYTFFPYGETVFDVSCLKEVIAFMDGLMDERKIRDQFKK